MQPSQECTRQDACQPHTILLPVDGRFGLSCREGIFVKRREEIQSRLHEDGFCLNTTF